MHYGTEPLDEWCCEACKTEFFTLFSNRDSRDERANFCPWCGAEFLVLDNKAKEA
jgi:hypothetical protein